MIQDSHGRTVSYLRLAITAECGSHCLYCRPAGHTAPAAPQMSADEIVSLVRHLVENHGLKKVRLTGGEPTARPDLIEIVQRLAQLPGLTELAMTTNGLTLAAQAKQLKSAGLTRVNIGLDTLIAEKYQRITGVDALPRALAGIDAAIAAGLAPVKLNVVVMRGQNDYELADLLLFAQWKKCQIRFIEFMPIGPAADRWQKLFVPESEIRQRLADVVVSWTARPDSLDPARKYYASMSYGRGTTVGFITAMSCPFCSTCNRLRIAADGSIYPCLMDVPHGNVLPALRPMFDPTALDKALSLAMTHKPEEHPACGMTMTETAG